MSWSGALLLSVLAVRVQPDPWQDDIPDLYYRNEVHDTLHFCGSEMQGFTIFHVNDGCSDFARVTVVEEGGFRSGNSHSMLFCKETDYNSSFSMFRAAQFIDSCATRSQR